MDQFKLAEFLVKEAGEVPGHKDYRFTFILEDNPDLSIRFYGNRLTGINVYQLADDIHRADFIKKFPGVTSIKLKWGNFIKPTIGSKELNRAIRLLK